jgi:hypothetical protein
LDALHLRHLRGHSRALPTNPSGRSFQWLQIAAACHSSGPDSHRGKPQEDPDVQGHPAWIELISLACEVVPSVTEKGGLQESGRSEQAYDNDNQHEQHKHQNQAKSQQLEYAECPSRSAAGC